MPYYTRKVRNKKCYRVSRKVNKIKKNKTKIRVFSKCTTLAKAKKQIRLLHAIENNKIFVPNSSVK
jgi:hypothetical protein